MFQEGFSCFCAMSGHDVDDAGGYAGFRQSRHKVISRQWGVFGRLDDYRVTADKGRDYFPRWNRHREIPGSDKSTDTDRFARAHCVLIGKLGLGSEAVKPSTLAGYEVSHVDGFLHVAPGLFQDLAHLARHIARKFFFALYE